MKRGDRSSHISKELRSMKDRATTVCWKGNQILLVAKARSKWSLPGGKPERGEQMVDAAIREVQEETRLLIERPRLACLFVDPRAAHHVFEVDVHVNAVAKPSNEIKHCLWVTPDQISTLRTSSGTREIIELVARSRRPSPPAT
ncbi:NUDIX hydrolase [Caballeronia sordidicola]|uniref:MutT/nudix family protein n=2 Tax=Burkholderiales TaxID=80840 RepID=A0A242MGC7_CABSO|nr:NUDIX domain-containing protein [Caballeronia sordidicola]OTP70345.1 MutT/nudix family protein [Caballeronia sordidicola]